VNLKIDTGDLILDRKKNRILVVLKNATKENGLPDTYYTLHVLTQDCKQIGFTFKKDYEIVKL
jgi:hypothetical protein